MCEKEYAVQMVWSSSSSQAGNKRYKRRVVEMAERERDRDARGRDDVEFLVYM